MTDRFRLQAHVFPGLMAFTHFINGRGDSDPLVVRWPLPASILVARLKEIDWEVLNYETTEDRLAKICNLGTAKRGWFTLADTLNIGNLTGQTTNLVWS